MEAAGKGKEAMDVLKSDVAKVCVPQANELVNLQLETARKLNDWESMASFSKQILETEYVGCESAN